MRLEDKIALSIKDEADKLISRFHNYHNYVNIQSQRNSKRLGVLAPKKVIHTPD